MASSAEELVTETLGASAAVLGLIEGIMAADRFRGNRRRAGPRVADYWTAAGRARAGGRAGEGLTDRCPPRSQVSACREPGLEQSLNAWEVETLEKLERRAAAGGEVTHAILEPECGLRRDRLPASDDGCRGGRGDRVDCAGAHASLDPSRRIAGLVTNTSSPTSSSRSPSRSVGDSLNDSCGTVGRAVGTYRRPPARDNRIAISRLIHNAMT
jgi:hypothetical protein